MAQATEIRQYKQTGEKFACDPEAMQRTVMLHHSELDADWPEYQLDYQMEDSDLYDSEVIRFADA